MKNAEDCRRFLCLAATLSYGIIQFQPHHSGMLAGPLLAKQEKLPEKGCSSPPLLAQSVVQSCKLLCNGCVLRAPACRSRGGSQSHRTAQVKVKVTAKGPYQAAKWSYAFRKGPPSWV